MNISKATGLTQSMMDNDWEAVARLEG